MTMKIPYYPGCTLTTVAKSFDESARRSAELLGFSMEELEQWNCCGASYPLTPDNLMGLAAPVKVLAKAAKAGEELTTLCSVCYNVLKRTNSTVKADREKRKVVTDFIEEEYNGEVNVIHFFEILRDKIGFTAIKEKVKRPLKGLKVAPYYGCMLLRPFEDVGIDDAEAPTIIEDLLGSLGAEPVTFPDKIECCGAHLAMGGQDIVERLSGRVLSSAVGCGAEVVVTSCPLCQYNLERSQKKLVTETAGYSPVPVVYFTQLLGLTLGQDEGTLGFDDNEWDIRPLLKERTI